MTDRPKAQAADSPVVPSPAMIPPSMKEMTAKRAYPQKEIPPAAHARTWYDMENNVAGLTYNGVDIVTLSFPEGVMAKLRYHSDGNFLSAPFTQQSAITAPAGTLAQVTFAAPCQMWNMRPERAANGRAILGQMGYPLLYGVNGIYLPDWDLLISWHGQPFDWQENAVEKTEDGYRARMAVSLSGKPWLLLLRPRYYGEHLGFSGHKPWVFRPNPRAVTGWCSWEAYHSDVTQQDIAGAAQALQELKPYGLGTMQLDDGFQQVQVPMDGAASINDSWLQLNEKFPGGHAAIVEAMQGGGFEAGVWTNATITNKEGAQALDCCLYDAQGELLKGDWIQYVLDCRPETLRAQTTPYYRAFREAGYTYYKSDSIRHLIYDGMQEAVRLGLMDDETARGNLAAYLRAAREGMGRDAYYLSCWGVLSQSIGICDAMRVATDSNPSWGSFSMQLRETARWFGAQRVLFTLDPDVVCVRGPLPWARMLLSLVALTGGLLMISDKPELYDAQRLELIRRTIPGLATRAAETGPIDYTNPACCFAGDREDLDQLSFDLSHIEDTIAPFASLWCTHFEERGRRWSVMQRCAVVPLEAAEIALENLALDPKKEYAAFDYWAQTPVPVTDGRLSLPALGLGDTTVVSLAEKRGDLPLLIGSDRHVSMDAVSVAGFDAAPGRAALSLKGFAGLEAVYTLYAPGLKGCIERQAGCTAKADRQGEYVTVSVCYQDENAFVIVV